MGLLDFLRPKKTVRATTEIPIRLGQRFVVDRDQMFSLHHTRCLEELFRVPRENRDTAWTEAFYDAAWYASIELGDPLYYTGPDGFSYYRLNLPRPNRSFDSQSLGNLALECCERYAGAAIFASPEDPDTAPQFVFTMGLLDSMLRFDSPDGDPLDRAESRPSQQSDHFDVDATDPAHEILTVTTSHKIMTAAPSADYLPPYAARGLERYMTYIWGISDPTICLLVDPVMNPSRSLVIGRKRSSFVSDEEMKNEMNRLLWFLPGYRSIIAMPEEWGFKKMYRLADLTG